MRLACELISDTNATLLLEFFPEEKRKKDMAYVFNLLNKSFDLFTSNGKSKNTEYWKSPFDMYLPEQLKLLQDVKWLFKNQIDIGQSQFPKGALITIECLIELQKILKNQYNIEYFDTAPANSDDLEGHFGEIKEMWNCNGCDSSPLKYLRKTRQWCKIKILEDTEFDLFSMETELM